MRMWMVDPKILCQKHLCGEHLETHMLCGSLKKKIKVSGYINNNLFEPKSLKSRHDELANEMINRGYNHKSSLEMNGNEINYLSENEQNTKIDLKKSTFELLDRCPECNKRFLNMRV